MKDLMTRKIVLGMLVAFVLVFGVQGIVDALTATIVDTVNTTGAEDFKNPNAYEVNEDIPQITITPTAESITGGSTPTQTIQVTATGIKLISPILGTSVKFSNNPTSSEQSYTSGTGFTLDGYFTGTAGTKTITITYTDIVSADEKAADPPTQTSSKTIIHTYTYYVVKSDAAIPETTTLTLKKDSSSVNSQGYFTGLDGRTDFYIYSGGSKYPVTYDVSSGGRLYRSDKAYENTDITPASATSNTPTSSSFPEKVWLDMNGVNTFGKGSTRIVTVNIGNDVGHANAKSSHKVAYIIGTPKLDITLAGVGNVTVVQDDDTKKYILSNGIQGQDAGHITATVTDGSSIAIADVLVEFKLKHTGSTTGNLRRDLTSGEGTRVDAKNNDKTGLSANGVAQTLYVRTNSSGVAKATYRFGTLGSQEIIVSSVSLSEKVTAEFGSSAVFKEISDDTNQQQSGNSKRYDLIALVKDGKKNIEDMVVTFTTNKGSLTRVSLAPTSDREGVEGIATGKVVNVVTNNLGQAHVVYDIGDNTGQQEIFASIYDNNLSDDAGSLTPNPNVITGVAESTFRRQITFVINGDDDPDDPPQTTNRLTISTTGEGTTRSVTVNALTTTNASIPGVSVLLSGTATTTQTATTGTPVSITLPSTPSTYTLIATDTGGTFDPATITVTVSAPGTLAIEAVGARSGTQQQLTVTATGGTIPSGGLLVRLTGVTNPTTVTIPSGSTSVSRIATLPSATSAQTVSASATGFSDAPSITIPAPGTTPTTPTTPTGPAGVADSIEIDGSRQRSGTLAQATALRARVLDANDRGVSGVGVTFRVLAPGQGTFAGARGSGRAIRVETNSTGYASTRFTPTRAANSGTVIVEAKAAGVSAPVTFIITIGEGTTDTGTSDPVGQAKTYKVGDKVPISLEDTLTFSGSRTISGTVYTCVGSGECVVSYGTLVKGEIRATAVPKVEAKTYKVGDKISISLEDTLTFSGSRTVSGTTYTCVGSGKCVISYGTLVKGEIRVAAPTSGTDRTPSRTINPEVLMGAAQRPPLLWVDSGTIYALAGADVQEFATGIENVQNIAISGNKLYWTEMTGANAGTINSANLDGTGAKQLVSIKAVPRGIAVDSAGKRLYWTNSHGWIQSSNLQGTARRNVARDLSDPMGIAVGKGYVYYTPGDGRIEWHQIGAKGEQPSLGLSIGTDTPGSLAIFGNKLYWPEMTGANAGTINSANLDGTGVMELVSIKAVPQGITVDPVAKRLYWTNSHGWIQSSNLQGTARRNVAKGLGSPGGIVLSANIKAPATPTTPTKTPTPAKPNYDVDGSGTVDNADVVLVALAVGTNEATYDVNGDGTVDDKDISLVRDNRDNGAASAPMVVGIKLTAEQVGRLQAQIDLLIASGDRSPDALKTLVYLQQLIATAHPDQTQLLANYPNPFNPETWIPYELATDSDVRITIYNAQGVVIRTLQLGQQSAGYYTDRERAAYWDGRNALGEQVASGIYFYQLETDTMSALRKMVILK